MGIREFVRKSSNKQKKEAPTSESSSSEEDEGPHDTELYINFSPLNLPYRTDPGWDIPDSAKNFDAETAVFGNFELITDIEASENGCNAAVLLTVNALRFQLLRLTHVVNLVRSRKQYLTMDYTNAMYDWIQTLQVRRLKPILECIQNDVLPELANVVFISEESQLHVDNRDATFAAVLRALDEIVMTSNALTPRLPSGERVFVLIYKVFQFEPKLLALLDELVLVGIPQRKLTKPAHRAVSQLEKYTFQILSYEAGIKPEVGGGISFDKKAAQAMTGVLTAWMSDAQVKEMRSRVGIHFYNRRQGKAFRQAASEYGETKESIFVKKFESALESELKQAKRSAKAHQDITQMLSKMAAMREREEARAKKLEDGGSDDSDSDDSDDEIADGANGDGSKPSLVVGHKEITLIYENVYRNDAVSPVSDASSSP